MQAGAATIVITPTLGSFIQGAGKPEQRAESVHDELEANALYLAGDGAGADAAAVLLVSCDLVGMEPTFARRCGEAMAGAAGLEARQIIIGCSHTHGGPVMIHSCYQKPIDQAYGDQLVQWLTALAQQARQAARPARLGWGMGHARLGYNRRVCYADGSHAMYRQAGRDQQFTGVEGPDDTRCLALAVVNEQNRVQAVLHQGTGHPAGSYGLPYFTADYPGVARRLVREALGPLPVLFFNGAQGDIAMTCQTQRRVMPENATIQAIRFGSTLAGETLRLLHEMQLLDHVPLQHYCDELEVAVRLPSAEEVTRCEAVLARVRAGADIQGQELISAWGPYALMQQFGSHPRETLPFHTLRIGDLAISTEPFELFCQYQLDLKRRSPFASTAVFGLTGGCAGYVPTLAAQLGGGYSGSPLLWARHEPQVGQQYVDHAARRLHELWRGSR